MTGRGGERPAGPGVAVLALAAFLAYLIERDHLVLPAIGVVLIALACTWAFLPARHLPRYRVRHLRLRLRLRLHPVRGHASLFELWLRWGRLAAFRESGRARPSLSAWQRMRHPQSHSAYLGRAHMRHTLRVTAREGGAIIGPPGSNKTALLSRLIMAAPGAVVCTSSKPDLFTLTSGLRARRGPVYVFNPMGLGGIPSTVQWDPVAGCLEPATAIRRADQFSQAVSTAGAEDASFWAGKSSDYMRGFFGAAAINQANMKLVARWVRGEQTHDAIATLAAAGHREWAGTLGELEGPAEKTTATVRMVMSRAVGYMHDPQLAAATLPARGCSFGIDEFLLSGGTLYMIAKGNGEDCTLAPLFAALAGEIQFRATQLASRMPGGRLDPYLSMALDEVTNICPIPLPQWTADSGGQGIQIWSAFHGISQLRKRWGAHGAQAVLDTSNILVVMPGVKDTETLDHLSKLCGHAAYREHGQEHHSRHDAMTPDMIRQLPLGFALLIRSGHFVIARLAKGWKDRGYRRLRRRNLAVATLAAPPAAAAIEPPRWDEPGGTVARLRPVPDIGPGGAGAAEVMPPAGQGGSYPWGAA